MTEERRKREMRSTEEVKWDEDDLQPMLDGVAEVRKNLKANEHFGISMISLRTADARQVVNYIDHLEGSANKAAVDLTSLERWTPHPTVTNAMQLSERGNYLRFIDVATLLAAAAPAEEAKLVAHLYQWIGDDESPQAGKVIARGVEEMGGNIDMYPQSWKRLDALYTHAAPAAQPDIEAAAKAIYEAMPADRTGDSKTCPWQPGGNSFKQDEARRYARAALSAAPTASQPAKSPALDYYDAGLLSDHGGGNVEWWQDYIRAELGRAHDFYQSQADGFAATTASQPDEARDAALREAVAEGLRRLWGCGRVWSAWDIGTMGRDDFYAADESEECIDQVIDAIKPFLAPTAASPSHPDPEKQQGSARELGEVISYAITAYKKGVTAEKIFTVSPTDANGYLAHFIVSAIEHHRPDVANSPPHPVQQQEQGDELPPLPPAQYVLGPGCEPSLYDGNEMQDYARAALAQKG